MNRTRLRMLVVLGALGVVGSCASAPDAPPPESNLVTALPFREDAGTVLQPGEVCAYGISWGGVLPVGRITYSVESATTAEGNFLVLQGVTEPALNIEAFLKSAGTIRTFLDPVTFLPRASFWMTADSDPHTRTAWFDQARGVALAGKWARDFIQTRKVEGPRLLDPLAIVFLGRLLELPPPGVEVRALMVEGTDTHLVTLRSDGEEEILFDRERIPCRRVLLRTDPVDSDGQRLEEEPWSDLTAWVAETPGRPVIRISGKVRFGTIVMRLARRTLRDS